MASAGRSNPVKSVYGSLATDAAAAVSDAAPYARVPPDMGGLAAEHMLRERGRWDAKDIGFIYQGVSAAQHFSASAVLGDHAGRTVREIADRWMPNPATRLPAAAGR